MILGPIYAAGVLLGLIISVAYLFSNIMCDASPREVFGTFLLCLGCTVTWPITLVAWLILVLYKDDWKILR